MEPEDLDVVGNWDLVEHLRHMQLTHRALAKDVLTVLVYCPHQKNLRCYIGAVAGVDHERERHSVAAHGAPLARDIAIAIWPEFSNSEWR